MVPLPSRATETVVLKNRQSVVTPVAQPTSNTQLLPNNGQSLPLQPRHDSEVVLPTNEDLNNISDGENDLDGDDDEYVTVTPPGQDGSITTHGTMQHDTVPFTPQPVDAPSSNGAPVTVLNEATFPDLPSIPHLHLALENINDFNDLDTDGNLNGDSSTEVHGVNENLVANGNNLDRGDMGSVEVSAYNDLDAEDSISTASLDIAMQNNVEGITSTTADLLNNSVANAASFSGTTGAQNNFDMDEGSTAMNNSATVSTTVEAQNSFDMDDSCTAVALNSFDDDTTTHDNHNHMDAVVQNNNMGVNDQPNNLDTEESRTVVQNNLQPNNVSIDSGMTENNFDEVEVQVHHLTQQTGTHSHQSSQPPSSLSSVGSSVPSSNGVYTPVATQSPPISRKPFPTSAPAALRATVHDLTEDNQFDDEQMNDFSEDATRKTDNLTGLSQTTAGVTPSYVDLQREKWRASQEETVPPAPTSAPVGRGPLRATIESSSHTSIPSIMSRGGEVSILHTIVYMYTITVPL